MRRSPHQPAPANHEPAETQAPEAVTVASGPGAMMRLPEQPPGLAPVPPPGSAGGYPTSAAQPPLNVDPTQSGVNLWTSLDVSSAEGKRRVIHALGDPDLKPEDLFGQVYPLADVLCHVVTVTDQRTGEEVTTGRTVLIDQAGRTCGFVSGGIWISVVNLCQVYGPPPWDPAIPVILRQKTTRNGRRTYLLDVEFPALEGERGTKRGGR